MRSSSRLWMVDLEAKAEAWAMRLLLVFPCPPIFDETSASSSLRFAASETESTHVRGKQLQLGNLRTTFFSACASALR